ncbi:hypothetical protein DMC47_39025 [Nostoc sp. 3335mG]|nr:hypothetical protein DMC47_39025 [Nostoc sp. 3335mG]
MNAHYGIDSASTPQALDEEFKRRARKPSAAAASAMLARGRTVAYRNSDTPNGYVIRKHPDGRTETVKIDLEMPGTSTAR